MLDIKLFREQPEFVKEGLRKVGAEPEMVDEVVRLDTRRRELIFEVEQQKAAKNAASKEIGKIKDPEERQRRIAEIKAQGDRIPELDQQVAEVEAELKPLMLTIPNLPDPAVPEGKDESENVIVRVEGEEPSFDFEPKAHWDLGPELGIIDFARGVKISGSRFYLLRGDGARLQRALITFFLDLHTQQHGYTEVYPPALVKEHTLYGTAPVSYTHLTLPTNREV